MVVGPSVREFPRRCSWLPRRRSSRSWAYAACRELVAERRAAPLDPSADIVSALLQLGEDDEFVAGSVRQLLIAAHVAPTAAIASAVRHVAGDGDLQTALRDDPALVPAAVDELLRLYTPNQGFARTARAEAGFAAARCAPASRSRSC